jgi:hypothetical protein
MDAGAPTQRTRLPATRGNKTAAERVAANGARPSIAIGDLEVTQAAEPAEDHREGDLLVRHATRTLKNMSS